MSNKCFFCGTEIEDIQTSDSNRFYKCVNCGRYIKAIERNYDFEILNPNIDELLTKYAIYMYYNKTENIEFYIGSKVCYDSYILNDGYKREVIYLSKEMVENWYPNNFAEKIDMILLKLGEMTTYYGEYVKIDDKCLQLFFVAKTSKNIINYSNNEILQKQYIIDFLIAQGYINSNAAKHFQLTPKALERIYELQKNKSKNMNVFVAMKFGEDTKALREKIKEGLKGYNVRIMDEIEHNNQIVPEILHEIKNSKFVVAELSHRNNGAYYEAGYALGLGKEIIHICDSKKFKKNLHFDVSQVNTILYDNINEIPEKIQKRIKATIKI